MKIEEVASDEKIRLSNLSRYKNIWLNEFSDFPDSDKVSGSGSRFPGIFTSVVNKFPFGETPAQTKGWSLLWLAKHCSHTPDEGVVESNTC